MVKIVFIDVETGGLDPKVHPILQLSGKIMVDGRQTAKFDWLIRCPSDKVADLSPEALKVCNVTVEDVTSLDRLTQREVYFKFLALLDRTVSKWDKNDKAFFVGYNSNFDEGFIRQFFIDHSPDDRARQYGNFYGSYFYTPNVDIMGLAQFLLMKDRTAMVDFKLKTVYAQFMGKEKAESMNWHDANADIEATAEIFYLLADKFGLKLTGEK